MPHVIVKLYPGRSEDQKERLAAQLTRVVMATLNSSEESISIGIEEIEQGHWTEKVYNPDIRANPAIIYKEPGYKPF
jgi:4-oxalocrotonate tautomerase